MTITVLALPESISLQPNPFTIGAGDSRSLKAVMPAGQGSLLQFESSDPAIASVDADGAVTAHVPGSASITVKTQNGLQSTASVSVLSAPSRIQLSPRSAARSIGEGSLQLELSYGSEAEGGYCSFTSSNPAIAAVSESGLVRFLGVGTVQIRAESYNGRSAVCDLIIGETPGKVFFAKTEYKIALGDSITIPVCFDKGCESYRCSIADSRIAAANGERVRGLTLGSTTLTATTHSGLTASCTLTVVPPPTGVRLSLSEGELILGSKHSTLQLSASALPDGAGSVYYTSSDPDIASVDYSTGLVTAAAVGECIITATSYDGLQSDRCRIIVSPLLKGVRIGIDPGHQAQQDTRRESASPSGGRTKPRVSSGASGRATKIREHETNLTVGLLLRDRLEALGAEVYMTRETADVNISNQERAKMMNALDVDLVLRLHCNSAGSSSTRGVSVHIRKTCDYPASVVDGKALLAAESRLASAFLGEYLKATGFKSRGVKKSNEYTGNNWSTVPCLLVEMGFSSNATEDKLLNNPEHQQKMVEGMINGICRYMERDLPFAY